MFASSGLVLPKDRWYRSLLGDYVPMFLCVLLWGTCGCPFCACSEPCAPEPSRAAVTDATCQQLDFQLIATAKNPKFKTFLFSTLVLNLVGTTVHLSRTNLGTLPRLCCKNLLLNFKMFFDSPIKLNAETLLIFAG